MIIKIKWSLAKWNCKQFVNKGIPINKFVELKSKMYSMLSDDGKKFNIPKGVNTATEFNEFRDTLFNKKVDTKWKKIRSKKHKLGTYEISEISLLRFDDKSLF